jgi:hypothetical protein
MNDCLSYIEKVRRRAKDGKAKNAEYFLTLSFETLDRFRNLLITLSVVGFGFLQSVSTDLTNRICILSSLFIAVVFGVVSYLTSFFSTMYEANYYSRIEKIFSMTAFPTQSQYEKMVKEEEDERLKKKNLWWIFSIFFLCLQTIFVLIAIKSLI